MSHPAEAFLCGREPARACGAEPYPWSEGGGVCTSRCAGTDSLSQTAQTYSSVEVGIPLVGLVTRREGSIHGTPRHVTRERSSAQPKRAVRPGGRFGSSKSWIKFGLVHQRRFFRRRTPFIAYPCDSPSSSQSSAMATTNETSYLYVACYSQFDNLAHKPRGTEC